MSAVPEPTTPNDHAVTPAPGVTRATARTAWRSSGVVGRIAVNGSSMCPLLNDGDTVRIRGGKAPRFGQIAVADLPSGLVIHRVIGRRGTDYLLRGDGTRHEDSPLPEDAILGLAIALEGLSGRRLDSRPMLWVGRVIASYSRLQHTSAPFPRRTHPGRLVAAYLRAESLIRRPIHPADAFTLAAARLQPAGDLAERARSLSPADWERVGSHSLSGQIGPLVHASLARLGDDARVPDRVRSELRRQYRGSALRALENQRLLRLVLERLAAENIPVLAHKGIALGLAVYPEPALRIAADLDLSVQDHERARAEAAVADIRNALVEANPDRRSQSGYHIELDGTAHHDVDPSLTGAGRWKTRSLDWDGIWQRARPIDVAGYELLVPCATDLMITLVANAVRRGFSPVRLVADIAVAATRLEGEVDWDQFEQAMRTSGLASRSWAALSLAIDCFGAPVPAALAEAPSGLRTAFYERRLLEHKARRPFDRVPTSVMWAGSYRGAAAAGLRLATRSAG